MSSAILFMCGSLNAGKNGVGDYTRVLAGHLQAYGCRVSIVASHDQAIKGIVRENQREGNQEIVTLRISTKASEESRWETIRGFVAEFGPEVISLQFVPFSFDARGFPYRFVRELSRPPLCHLQWHVMFHELWVGNGPKWALKRRLLAQGQRWLIKKLYRGLNPAVVHSHLPTYLTDLARIGIPAQPLPLFANVAARGPGRAPQRSVEAGPFRMAFFSQMELSPPIATFIEDLLSAQSSDREGYVEVLLIGGNAQKIDGMRSKLIKRFPSLSVLPVGFLSNEALGEQLGGVDLGITPVPFHALGKSGTIAAFLAQGVPVAAPKITKQNCPFLFPAFNEAVLTAFTPEGYRVARTAAGHLPVELISPERVSLNFMEDLQRFALIPLPDTQKNYFRS